MLAVLLWHGGAGQPILMALVLLMKLPLGAPLKWGTRNVYAAGPVAATRKFPGEGGHICCVGFCC
jgi:hypothetical protein